MRIVNVPQLQRRLHAGGGATIYVGDVLLGRADFAAVQWWASLGGLHGLAPNPADRLPQPDGRTTRGDWIRAAFKGAQ